MKIDSFKEAEKEILRQIAEGVLPCAVMATQKGKEIRISTVNGKGENEPELRYRIFLLASISKAITGVLFAVLHEQCLIKFTDKLNDYLSEMNDPADSNTTIGNIFTHCTGYSTGVDLIDRTIYTPEDYFLKILKDGHAYQPRTAMCYSTMTYQFLSTIVHRRTGQKLIELLNEKIFIPSGMKNTSFAPSLKQRMPVINGLSFDALASSEMSGAGFWSTVDDLLSLASALKSCSLFTSNTLKDITTIRDSLPFLNSPNTLSQRTWGWNKEKRFNGQPDSGFYHGGATGTLLWIDPDSDFIFVLLTNRWGCGNEHSFSILKHFYV